ncbi:MAG: tRNA (guanosine(46)-N7)-methyltransferase TrmB, partial [Duncaniella sp.]|nr:tRNA (guanosine(46)-N7)-methyltransferase TrmB [Duncaniella sp.]
MGKNKLKKFAEMETLPNVHQYPFAALRDGIVCPCRGVWAPEVFHNSNPITLELGCGKGEYAVGMGRSYPDRNFIGIDIKGARMWTGAKEAHAEGLSNVAFLRTSIHLLPEFFAPAEVSEIWITFPDPQMKKVNKRLTGTHFLDIYRKVLAPGGVIRLKTDSPFLYTYTKAMAEHNSLEILAATDRLYDSEYASVVPAITTYYEQQWLSRGIPSKYIAFRVPAPEL